MKTARMFLLALAVAAAMPHRALACVCERDSLADSGRVAESAVRGNFERAKVVFVGKMVEHAGVEQRFEVARVLKGEAGGSLVLHRGEIDPESGSLILTSCEYDFEPGAEYLVYAFEDRGTLSTHACARTRLVERAELDLRLIEQLRRSASK